MSNRVVAVGSLGAALVFTSLAGGCGWSSGRADIDAISDEEHFGMAVKATLYEFRAKVRKHGVEAARQEAPALLESLEGYEKRKLGEHDGTYKQIVEKLKALESSGGGDAAKVAEEIGALADKLPGTANPDPEVE